MSLLEFANGDEEAAARAALLSTALQSAGPEVMALINAAGLIRLHEGATTVAPFLFLDQGRSGSTKDAGVYPVEEFRSLLPKAFYAALGPLPEWFNAVQVWLAPPASPQLQNGRAIQQHDLGTVGFPVRWSGGEGFLTAGHVAKLGKGPVTEPGQTVAAARVVFSKDPTGSGAAAEVDVAVIEAIPQLSQNMIGAFRSTPITADNTDRVDFLTGRTHQDWIKGYATTYYCVPMQGSFGEVFMAASGTTKPGDSGAAVAINGHPVGTVVAGNSTDLTLIQKFDYQVRKTGLVNLAIA
ncbi:MAG: hypothetical protein ACU0GG_14160 [Paracoccaceae bacterium]